MRKVRYGVASSLDGFIAGPNGEYDWITMDPEIDFAAMFAQYDTILMGRGTFGLTGGGNSMPGMENMDVHVFSRTLDPAKFPKVNMHKEAVPVVKELKARPGKDIWVFGGGVLFRSLLDAGLVDEIELGVIPVMLGDGLPLMPGPYTRAQLKLASSKVFGTGILMLTYEIKPATAKKKPRKKS